MSEEEEQAAPAPGPPLGDEVVDTHIVLWQLYLPNRLSARLATH